MALDDDDVREILRLIDESDVEELRVETEGLSLYVRRGDVSKEAPIAAEPEVDRGQTDGLHPIPAPMLGTFYRAPAPGATPFVDVGTRVEEETVVCLIEVMKMMNAVPAGVTGTIVEVCAENAAVVDIVDTTTRDGNQSLWSATGLTTQDILAIAPTIDRVGFRAVDFSSSTHMAVAVRFHQEDPWERLRLVRAAMPETPLSFITSGMRFITWVPADEDVMRLAFRCVARNGIRRVQVVDPSNEVPRLRRVAAMARQEGVQETVLGLTYSISEVHTHAYYAERAAALADCSEMDAFYLKDPGGLLTPDAVRELAPHFLSAAGDRPVELHSHCTIGLAPLVYAEGLRAGFQVLHTAVGPLARGTSNPAVETTLRDLEAEGRSHRLDLEALAAMAEHFRAIGREKGL